MSIFTKIFGTKEIADGIGSVVGTISDTVSKFVLTGKDKFDAEQQRLEREWRFKTIEEESFQKEQERLVAYYKMDADDRADARDFAKAEIASGDKFVSHFRYWFAAGICFAILVLLGTMLLYDLPPRNNNIIMFILGTLTSTLTSIVSFYFGSSSGSAIKDQVIQKQANELGKPA